MKRALPLLLFLLLATAPAQAATVVRSGPLSAVLTPNPWRLEFTDASGRAVVGEKAGAGLGFRDRSGNWVHATRVVSGHRVGQGYEADVATSDPLGRHLRVRITADASGIIRVRAEAAGVGTMGESFGAASGERWLGFGERSDAVARTSGTVEDKVVDGPYQPEEAPFIAAFVPAAGYSARQDATYFPIPWLLSTRGYGVLDDDNETSRFVLREGGSEAWRVEVDAAHIDLRVIYGPRPADAVRRVSARLGRQPKPAAPFYFGPWFQPEGPDTSQIATLKRADAPVSVAQTYTHYLPCGSQQGQEAAERARTALYHAAGMAITTYFNPMICTSYHAAYDPASAHGYLTQNSLGQDYTYNYTGSTIFRVGQVDFTAPGAVAFYGSLLDQAVKAGYDGWMEDFGEYTPPDAVSHDGTPGPAMHNRYPLLYHGAARTYAEHQKRPLARFNRSGWTGAAKVSQIVWGGDPTTGFGFDGLSSAVRQALTLGVSGLSLWGSDIGGYFSLGTHQLTPELLQRWIEFGAASPVMRTEGSGFALPAKSRAQILDPDVLPIWRRYAKLHTELYPYVSAAERTYERTGLPLVRALLLAYPRDPAAAAIDDEYLFGPDLLVAPVLTAGAVRRMLHLPPGRWVDLWRSARVLSDGSLSLGAARVLSGPGSATLPAPRDELPLLVRAGALLSLLPADVDTLTDYGHAPGLVHLRDRAGSRTLLAFPRGTSSGGSERTGTLISRENPGGWTLGISDARSRVWHVQASLRTLRHPLVPCAVFVGGRRVRFRYDPRTQVMRFALRGRRVRADVLRRCPAAT